MDTLPSDIIVRLSLPFRSVSALALTSKRYYSILIPTHLTLFISILGENYYYSLFLGTPPKYKPHRIVGGSLHSIFSDPREFRLKEHQCITVKVPFKDFAPYLSAEKHRLYWIKLRSNATLPSDCLCLWTDGDIMLVIAKDTLPHGSKIYRRKEPASHDRRMMMNNSVSPPITQTIVKQIPNETIERRLMRSLFSRKLREEPVACSLVFNTQGTLLFIMNKVETLFDVVTFEEKPFIESETKGYRYLTVHINISSLLRDLKLPTVITSLTIIVRNRALEMLHILTHYGQKAYSKLIEEKK